MHALLMLGLFALGPQTREPAPTTPERIAQAVDELKRGLASNKPEERRAAIVTNSEVIDPTVVELVAKGLRDGDATVRDAAAEALRFARHPAALTALSDALKRERKSDKDPAWHAKLLKCVGQHQSESAVALLAEKPLQHADASVDEAQILALGNTRSRAGVEALFGMMRSASREEVQKSMPHLRLSLMVATGVDHGLSQDAWTAWWNTNKAKFTPPREMPALPLEMLNRWNGYWGLEYVRPREKKRDERGDDPERGK